MQCRLTHLSRHHEGLYTPIHMCLITAIKSLAIMCQSGHEVNFMKAKAKSDHDEINLHPAAWDLMFHGIRSLCAK